VSKDQVEGNTTTTNPFFSQTIVFSDTASRYHQSRIVTTIDYISDINQIGISDGLKNSLIECSIDLETLLNTAPERTAKIFGIEMYVVKLIHIAASKQSRLRPS
jgi:hypothetical protein